MKSFKDNLLKITSHVLKLLFILYLNQALADDPGKFLSFSSDFAAKCVTRGGKMIYLSNNHPSKEIMVTLERWYMNNKTADRGRSILPPKSAPDPLGCSKISEGKQEWKILKAEWVKKWVTNLSN